MLKNDKLVQKKSHFRSKMIISWAEIWKIFENRNFEGLEISVKSDRAVKSEKFFNPGWSWPTLSEFLWFPSCYQPQTKLKVSQFIRFFFDCGHVVYIKSSCVSPLTDLYTSIPSSRSRMETASLILCLARASNSCSNQLIKMTSYFLDSYSKHSTGGHASYHTCL